MAVISTLSNRLKFQMISGNIDFDADVFKVILMNNTFAFDPDADDTLADVTADQLATGGGYTQNNETLANIAITRDDVNDKTTVTWDNPSWTGVSSGAGPTGAAIIYDDTTPDDTVVGAIDYGVDFTIGDGIDFQLTDIEFDLT